MRPFLLTFLLVLFSKNTFSIEETLEFYLKDENLEKAVAQLFVVGYPGDIYNYTKCSDCQYLIDELGIGGVIINQYNAPQSDLLQHEKQVAFRKVSDLVRDIKYRARSSSRTLYKKDPTLMLDFESYRFSSLRYPFTPPPSALALASTGDANYSYYAGILSGFQLNQLGIDVVLGPVLDLNVYKNQGQPNSSIRDRAFSDRPKIIYEHANAYIEGLKKSGMQVFIKHFPSYSYIDSNPHSSSSSYIGSHENLIEELKLFEKLSAKSDGIMTSHLNLGVSKNVLPFTFAGTQVSKYLTKNKSINHEAIFITDDLSDMASVQQYMSERKKTYGDIALEALLAGHNYLLFSHLGRKGGFDRYELSKTIKHIAHRASRDKNLKNKIRKSLEKVFKFKQNTNPDKSTNYFNSDASEILENTNYKNQQDFLRSTLKEGAVLIKGNKDGELPNIRELSSDRKYLVIAKKTNLKQYRDFDQEGANYNLSTPPKYRSITEYQNFLIRKLRKYDLVYITVDNLDDGNAVDHIRIHYPKLLDKLVVLLHDTPANLSALFINKAPYILANFSKNPTSYNVDLDFILYGEKPKSIKHLPISLNKGAFHNSRKAPKIIKAKLVSEDIKFYDTEKEQILDEKVKLYEKIIINLQTEKVTAKRIVFLVLGVLWLLLGLILFTKPIYDMDNSSDNWERFKSLFKNIFNSYSSIQSSPFYLLIGSTFAIFSLTFIVWTSSVISNDESNDIPLAVIQEVTEIYEDKKSSSMHATGGVSHQ